MVELDQQIGLGQGLPRCLDGLLRLQKPLYLSGPRRHRVLRSAWVRARVDAVLRTESDEAVIVSFYGNPQNRRELWDHWRHRPPPAAFPPSVPGRGRTSRPKEETPPSLEHCILDELDRQLLRSAESDDVLLDRLGREVDSRLNDWAEATEDERRQAIHLTFALASLHDDRSILQDAVERTPDLEAEFEALLRGPALDESPDAEDGDAETADETAEPEAEEPETAAADVPELSAAEVRVERSATSAADRQTGEPSPDLEDELRLEDEFRRAQREFDLAFEALHGLIEQVDDAEALTVVGGFATELGGRVQALQGDLVSRRKELQALTARRELRSAADRFLEEIAELPAAAGIRADVESLAERWQGLSRAWARREAAAELARLQADVPPAVETLERTHEEHDALERERQQLRERPLTSREAQRRLDDRLDALREPALAARNRHRLAVDDLLEALAPTLPEATLPEGPAPTPEAAGAPAAEDSTHRPTQGEVPARQGEAATPAEPAMEDSTDAAVEERPDKSVEPEERDEPLDERKADAPTPEASAQAEPAARDSAGAEASVESEKLDEPGVEAPALEEAAPAEPAEDESADENVERDKPKAVVPAPEEMAPAEPAEDESADESSGRDKRGEPKAMVPAPEEAAPAEPEERAEAPAPEEPVSEEATPRWTEEEEGVRNALMRALSDEPPRLAEAFQICRLADELEIAAGQPRSATVEAALYASHLQGAQGELASELRDAIERDPGESQAGCTPEQENTEALLRFAAALVPALLAPHTGAAAWLKALTHEGLPAALYRFAQQAAEKSWAVQTAQMDVRAFLRRARRDLEQEDELARIRQEMARWRHEEARLPLGYIPANKVWRALFNEGPLGELASAVETRASAAGVRRHLEELEDDDKLRRCLDDLSGRLLSSRQSIDGKIFKQIQRRLKHPCELACEYELIEATTEQVDYRRRVMSDFVRLIREDAPGLRDALDEIRARKTAEPLVRAAANAARHTVSHVENLVDPEWEAHDQDEPEAEIIRASGLFLHPNIRIGDAGLTAGEPEEALQALVSSPPCDVEAALAGRIEAADLQTAERILDWPTTAEHLGADDIKLRKKRLDSSRNEHFLSLQEEAETLRDDLEEAYLYGQLEPDDRLELDARLSSLEDRIESTTVVHFDRSFSELRRLRRNLEGAKDESLQKLRSEAQRQVADDPDRLRKIERHVDDGDFVAANELIYRTSEPVPQAVEDREGSRDLLDSYLAADRAELRDATRDWTKVVEAAKTGQRHGSLAFDELDEDYRSSASGLLESWNRLRSCSRSSLVAVAKASRKVFRRLGFLNVQVRLDPDSRKSLNAWTGGLFTTSLSDRADCAVAQFGSLAAGRYRLLVCFEPPTGTQVLQCLRSGPAGQPAIVVCVAPLSDRVRAQLSRASFKRKLPFLLLDELLLAFVAAQASSPLASFFALSLPFSCCTPFQQRASFVPPELFFGREREKNQLTDFHGSCFLYGGRQLGKTALLRRVQAEFTAPEHGRFAAWIDLKAGGIGDADTADIWSVIWDRLRELNAIDETVRRPTRDSRSVQTFCEALHARFNAGTERKLLLLLDEADNFLRRDALNSSRATFAESSRLKSLMDRDRAIKVVFAGLHNVLRTTSQSNHPLAHLGKPICIGPFIHPLERRQAELLLGVPLQACGYRFEPPRLMRSVLARTNYYPSLLQIYGNALATRLSEPARHPSLTDLPAVRSDLLADLHRDRDFQSEIRKRFVWTLELDPRYEAIAYVLAYMCRDDERILHGGIDARVLLGEVRAWWKAGFGDGHDLREFMALLEEMVELGVLRRTEATGNDTSRFSLRNSNVLALLGSLQDLEAKLEALDERPAPFELGPREIRRRHGEKGPLHRPLTLQQEHEIAGRSQQGTNRNEVVLVCGTEAAGVVQVRDFLLASRSREQSSRPVGGIGAVERLKASRTRTAFEGHLRSRLKARRQETTVFLADADIETWNENWLDAARRCLRSLRSRDRIARVVFIIGAERLMAFREAIQEREASGALRVVGLQPWSLDFAATCLDDDRDVGHRLDSDQELKLAELAGGWPMLLERVLEALRDGADPERMIRAASFRDLLRENASAIGRAFGLDHDELGATLHLASELGEATEEGLLDPESRELDECPLGDEELRSAIWAAGKLHLLQPTGSSEWRVNPVVKTVLQTPPD